MKLRDRKLETMHRLFGTASGMCGDCPHFVRRRFDKMYYKCAAYGLSHSEATDWRVRWHACGLIDTELPDRWMTIVKRLEWINKDDKPIGQISMFGGGTDATD
jgi:hypothetical protein